MNIMYLIFKKWLIIFNTYYCNNALNFYSNIKFFFLKINRIFIRIYIIFYKNN